MWFKNLYFFAFTRPFEWSEEDLEKHLSEHLFTPLGSTEVAHFGWINALGKHGDSSIHSVDGNFLICARKEEKMLPASVVKERLDEKVEQLQHEHSRKATKKEKEQYSSGNSSKESHGSRKRPNPHDKSSTSKKIKTENRSQETSEVLVTRLSPYAYIPKKCTPESAGFDLSTPVFVSLKPHRSFCIKTKIAVAIPKGYYGRIAPRSGIAKEYSISVLGGVIDSDFRGEIQVLLYNHGTMPATFVAGARIAQLIIEHIHDVEKMTAVSSLDQTSRGSRGFGSTGYSHSDKRRR